MGLTAEPVSERKDEHFRIMHLLWIWQMLMPLSMLTLSAAPIQKCHKVMPADVVG